MFGIGFTEFLVIGIIALLVVGPEKLPELAQKIGRFTWELRRAWDDVRDTMRSEMADVTEPINDLRSAGKNMRGKLDSELRKFKDDTQRGIKETSESLTEAARGKSSDSENAKPKSALDPDPSRAEHASLAPDREAGEPASVAAEGQTGASDGEATHPGGTVASEHPFRRASKQASKAKFFDLDGNPVSSVEGD